MSISYVLMLVLAIGAVAFIAGLRKAVRQQVAASAKPHSRSHYHGWWAFLLAVVPAVLFLAVWSLASATWIENSTRASLPEQTAESAVASRGLALGMVKSLASGLRHLQETDQVEFPTSFAELKPVLASRGVALAAGTQDYMIPLALQHNAMQDTASWIGALGVLILAIGGAVFA